MKKKKKKRGGASGDLRVVWTLGDKSRDGSFFGPFMSSYFAYVCMHLTPPCGSQRTRSSGSLPRGGLALMHSLQKPCQEGPTKAAKFERTPINLSNLHNAGPRP